MSIITANRNFLSSLGITDTTSFFSSFGDLAAFEVYCDSIGYDYDINEDDELILIDPDGKSIPTGVIIETTATPTLSYDSETLTVTSTGDGDVLLYIDGTLVPGITYTFPQSETEATFLVTSTAQEANKAISLVASLEVTVPGTIVDPEPQDPQDPEPQDPNL